VRMPGELMLVLLTGLLMSTCGCVPDTKLEECLASQSELQQTIDAQQKQIEELTRAIDDQQVRIDELTKQNSLDYSRLVMLGRTSQDDTTPSSRVTMTYPDSPRCEGGITRWRVVVTETSGVGVTLTRGVYYHRTLEDGKWSEPQGVSYYDAANNWFQWPKRFPPNWQEEYRTGDAGCFSDHRRYTWVYFGEDDNGHDIVAMGTIAVNEHN